MKKMLGEDGRSIESYPVIIRFKTKKKENLSIKMGICIESYPVIIRFKTFINF